MSIFEVYFFMGIDKWSVWKPSPCFIKCVIPEKSKICSKLVHVTFLQNQTSLGLFLVTWYIYHMFAQIIHIYSGSAMSYGEGNGTPLQYSCLENPMDRGAWWAAVHAVAKSQTQLSDFTFTFHFHALEKEMATHSSVAACRIPGKGEPNGLPSMGLHRVGHDWSNLAAAQGYDEILSSNIFMNFSEYLLRITF